MSEALTVRARQLTRSAQRSMPLREVSCHAPGTPVEVSSLWAWPR